MSISSDNLSSLISGTFGSSYSSISSLFSTSSSSSSDPLSSLYTDYASLKNGSYSKLIKAYYAKVDSSDSSSSSSSSSASTTDSKTAIASEALYSSISSLSAEKITEDNLEESAGKVSDLVDKYNTLIDTAASSDSKEVLERTLWLTNTTDSYSGLLKSAGVSVGSDNTLTFDKDTFQKANLTTLNELFSSTGSWLSRVESKASSINSAASQNSTSSSYTAAGQYMTSASSVYEALV